MYHLEIGDKSSHGTIPFARKLYTTKKLYLPLFLQRCLNFCQPHYRSCRFQFCRHSRTLQTSHCVCFFTKFLCLNNHNSSYTSRSVQLINFHAYTIRYLRDTIYTYTYLFLENISRKGTHVLR